MLKTMKTPGDTKWFVNDRFGLFIHWGLYSQAARHEWVQNNERIPKEVYEQKYFNRFDPDLYDPKAWARAASAAGMKYFVITTKHHEGFCLWYIKITDYKAPNTAAGRDLLKPMIKAFREENMRVGLYHSLIDWHHPHFILDPHIGPYRDHKDREALNAYKAVMRDEAAMAAYGRPLEDPLVEAILVERLKILNAAVKTDAQARLAVAVLRKAMTLPDRLAANRETLRLLRDGAKVPLTPGADATSVRFIAFDPAEQHLYDYTATNQYRIQGVRQSAI